MSYTTTHVGRRKVRISKEVSSQTTKAFFGIGWTPDDDAALIEYVQLGKTFHWIGEKLGRSNNAVSHRWYNSLQYTPAAKDFGYGGKPPKPPENKRKFQSRGGR